MVRKKASRRKKKPQTGLLLLLMGVIAGLLAVILVLFPRLETQGGSRSSKDNSVSVNEKWTEASEENESRAETRSSVKPESSAGSSLAVAIVKKVRVAIVIDDFGNDLAGLDAFLRFKGKLTIAVLPQLTHSEKTAKRAHEAGQEVILHLPMQPLGDENPGPGAIEVTFDRERIFEILKTDFSSVPFARGVNNHMGSLATQDKMVMDAVFSFLEGKGMYFLDSRTVQTTVARTQAVLHEIPFLERNIFLDIKSDKNSIIDALEQGIGWGRKNGAVIMIGHVQHRELADILVEKYDQYLIQGVEFVFVSQLLENAGGANP